MSTADEIIALRQGYQARRAERQAQEREQELKELREDPSAQSGDLLWNG